MYLLMHTQSVVRSLILCFSVTLYLQVIVVTEQFEGKSLVARHRMVMALFAEEMTGGKPKMHGESSPSGHYPVRVCVS